MLVWGRTYMTFPQLIPTMPMNFGEATITLTKLMVIVLSGLTMIGLMLLVNRTRLGRAMRATAENPRVAGPDGREPNFVIAMTFAIGAALAALAGVMLAATYGVAHFYMGFLPGLKAFTAAVLGGIGNIPGAMLGGLLLGPDRGARCGLHRATHWRSARQPLPGHLRIPDPGAGADLPAVRPASVNGSRTGPERWRTSSRVPQQPRGRLPRDGGRRRVADPAALPVRPARQRVGARARVRAALRDAGAGG